MRLIQKIRTKLIVALGGVTKEEYERLRDKYEERESGQRG